MIETEKNIFIEEEHMKVIQGDLPKFISVFYEQTVLFATIFSFQNIAFLAWIGFQSFHKIKYYKTLQFKTFIFGS